jgi:hypothetical protein
LNHLEKNKQRRDWLNWYSKTMNIMDLTAQSCKSLVNVPNAQHNYAERYKAKSFGFNVGPELAGDVLFLQGYVTNDFGDMVKA